MNNNTSLVEALRRSKIYREYEQAFNDATGLSVMFHPADSAQSQPDGKRGWSPPCAMMTSEGACGVWSSRRRLSSGNGALHPVSAACPVGLCDTAVPVRMGDQLIGFLQTGKMRCGTPRHTAFQRLNSSANGSESSVDSGDVRGEYLGARILGERQRRAIIKLLTLFSQHLSLVSNQILVQRANTEPPVISRARDYIARHYTEDLSLPLVARAVNTSTHYFCKLFKKHTGINFIDHVSRVRIERAKVLLRNSDQRVSEIAYEVGFQSLTHFNRVFKRIEGQAPTDYRRRLALCVARNASPA